MQFSLAPWDYAAGVVLIREALASSYNIPAVVALDQATKAAVRATVPVPASTAFPAFTVRLPVFVTR